jgi:hypothetical protein
MPSLYSKFVTEAFVVLLALQLLEIEDRNHVPENLINLSVPELVQRRRQLAEDMV